MSPQFIHLRVHSEYSLLDGIVRIKPLVKTVAAKKMPAVAITDQNNLFAAVKFYKAAIAAGIKPILGVDVCIVNSQQDSKPSRLTLLCQNQEGYKNITRLVSKAYVEGQHLGIPQINKSWFQGATEGVIALSGAREGDIGQALLNNNLTLAQQQLREWSLLFPDRYYLELQRTGREREDEYNQAALDLAEIYQVPVVATNDVRFLAVADYDAHEARVCIHDGYTIIDPRRPRLYSEQQYLRSAQEMAQLFADIPEALENTVQIAKRCNVELNLGKSFLPNFPIPSDTTMEQYLCKTSEQGLVERFQVLLLGESVSSEKQRIYEHRLKLELEVINNMGFAGYFLIVADFIHWAKQNGIPVGPGRGSGAGSLVAYALKITDVDPLQYDLLFERFLNPERVSMPDFDIDFCMDGRDRVIDYVAEKYGRESVSQIITYGTMAAKAVVRDVGRALGHPYGFVDKLAKLIPFELGITLDKALAQEAELRERYENEEEVRGLFDLALKLEGITRNAGKHAGGVVIAPSLLTDFAPLYCEPGGENLVTQFDKDDVEAVGLVKFDFLGLRTLTIIDWAVININEGRKQRDEPLLDITLIPMNDAPSYQLLKACGTTAVFQLESRGMKDLIKRLQPDCFEEIIALVALFRPGPLQSGMVDDFINRKHGRAKVEFPHADLEPILRPTYGIILYQEQVMQIAQVLAQYTLGSADLLRRAMGKKKPEEMAKQRTIFLEGSQARGVATETANYIFDLMEKFAGYGFNKSHSAAYALVSYQTAWLKTHYPAEFMAAVLSSDMDNTDKVVALVDECRTMKLKLMSPAINQSCYRFTVSTAGEIIYGLGAIKGVGEAAIASIVAEREQVGPYQNLFDFCQRIDLRKVNKRVLDGLIRCGALDSIGPHRAALSATLARAIQAAEQRAKTQALGQTDLFNCANSNSMPQEYAQIKPWGDEERLQGEKETLGHYISGHPLQRFEAELEKMVSMKLVDLRPAKNQAIKVAGMVVGIRTMFNKRGERIAFVTLDDRTGRIDLAVFSDIYNSYKDLLMKDQVLVVEGEVSVDEYAGGYKMSARKVLTIAQARTQYAKRLLLTIDSGCANTTFMSKLQQILLPYCNGGCPIVLEYRRPESTVKLSFGEKWQVLLADELIASLQGFLGEQQIVIDY